MKYLVLNYKIKFLNQYNEIINQEIIDIFFSTETNSTHFEPEKEGTLKRLKLIMTKKERSKEAKKHKQEDNFGENSEMAAGRNLENAEFDIESNLENSDLNEIEQEYTQKFMNFEIEELIIGDEEQLNDSQLDKEIAIPLMMDGNQIEDDGKSTRSRGKSKMSRSGVSRRTTKTNKTEHKARINFEARGRVTRPGDLHGPRVHVLHRLPQLSQNEGRQTA